MDQLLLAKLTLRRDELRELVGRKEAAVKKAPAGNLKYGRRKKDFEYYWRPPGAQTYSYIAKKNRKFAADLAQKGYDERILKAAKKELKLINKLIKACGKDEIDAAYDECSEGRKTLVTPVRPSDEEFRAEWNKQPSCLLGFSDNDPEYYTMRGERVRSKSEVIIANTLYEYGVDYLFGCELTLPGVGRVNPDFFVLDIKTRRTIVWEHLGKMDDPSYAERALRKINGYLRKGFIIGETLLLTFESGSQPINTAIIEKMVKYYFL